MLARIVKTRITKKFNNNIILYYLLILQSKFLPTRVISSLKSNSAYEQQRISVNKSVNIAYPLYSLFLPCLQKLTHLSALLAVAQLVLPPLPAGHVGADPRV